MSRRVIAEVDSQASSPVTASTTSGERRGRVRLVELDVLRFLAAVAVVIFHYVPRLREEFVGLNSPWIALPARFGYLGVDLFFLLSGYVIVMSASGRSARSFLVHRAVRLYPSFWTALALTLIAVWIFAPSQEHPSVVNILANVTMLPSYLGELRIDDVYWTLAIEWKFYVLVALVIGTGLVVRIEIIAMVWIGLLGMQSLGVDSAILRSLTIFPYGSYFASGAIIYFIREGGISRLRIIAFACGWLVSLATAARAMPSFIPDVGPHDLVSVLAVVSGIFGIFLWIALPGRQLRRSTAWQVLGAMTFPLYLVHSRLGQLLILQWQPFESSVTSLLCALVTVAGISFAMAWLIELRLVPATGRSIVVRKATGDRERPGSATVRTGKTSD